MQLIEPLRQKPNENWEHFSVWQKVYDLIEALPNYFKSEILIKGINVTDIYAVGNLFSAVIEAQIVDMFSQRKVNPVFVLPSIQTLVQNKIYWLLYPGFYQM